MMSQRQNLADERKVKESNISPRVSHRRTAASAAEVSGSGSSHFQSVSRALSAQLSDLESQQNSNMDMSSLHRNLHYCPYSRSLLSSAPTSIDHAEQMRTTDESESFESSADNGRFRIDVMPIKAKNSRLISDTQQTDLLPSVPKKLASSSSSLVGSLFHINGQRLNLPVMTTLLSLCYLILISASLSHGAPTKAIVSHNLKSLDNLIGSNGPDHRAHHLPVGQMLGNQVAQYDVAHEVIRPAQVGGHISTTTYKKQQGPVKDDLAADAGRIVLSSIKPDHHRSSTQESSSGKSSLVSSPLMARATVEEFVAPQDGVDEEIILLVSAAESSPSSFRRLIKRSGISDQRLAEIQMIRALKKQLERAATKSTTESGDGSSSAEDAN